MLPSFGGDAAIQALLNGAFQTAQIVISDVNETGHPTLYQLENENIIKGSLSISKASSGNDSVELGATISDQLTVSLRSVSDAGEDLLNSELLYGKVITVIISWVYEGTYSPEILYMFSGIITEDTVDGVIHRITALDAMIVFDRPYRLQGLLDDNNVQLTYPVTALNLLKAIVRAIGAPYIDTTVPIFYRQGVPVNESYTIQSFKEDDVTTYRQVMRYCVQMLGCNIRVRYGGSTNLELYRFTDLFTGDSDFPIFSIDESVSYRFSMTPPKYPNNRIILTILRAGKKIIYSNDNCEKITISDNPFFENTTAGRSYASNIVDALWNDVPSNLRVQLQASTVSMLYLEPGDIVRVPRPDGTTYAAIITSVTHKLNGGSVITASAAGDVLPTMISTPSFSQSQEATLNARFAQYDALLTHDYIVEQGTSTETTTDGATVNWNYRKWNSGVMELWGEADYFQNNTYTGIQVTPVTRGGVTIGWTTATTAGTTTMSPIPFPSGVEFISGPIVTATWNIGGLDVLVTVASVNRESGTTYVSFTPRLFCLTSSRIVGFMRIIVFGRWK